VLRGLVRDDVQRYLAATIGREPAPGLVEVVAAETEGNPFFIAEVMRLFAAEGRLEPAPTADSWRLRVPESIREVIGRRLDRLSPECNALLSCAAVIGRDFDLPLLERLI